MASSVTPDPEHSTDSQSLAELSNIFPNIDCNVLLSVLQAHDGQVDATVEYFMESSSSNNHLEGTKDNVDNTSSAQLLDDPSDDMIGRFSEDIGGLPEMLPSFIYNSEDIHSSDDEDSYCLQRSPTPESDIDSEDDPLPTYEEACTDADRLPEAVYVQDDTQMENDVIDVPNEVHVEDRASVPVATAASSAREESKKSKKHRKALRLAGKLKSKHLKIKIARGKKSSESSLSARSGYAPLSSDQEFEEETDSA